VIEEREAARVFIGLGSNLGDRAARIDSAFAWLAAHPALQLVRCSEVVETAPWGIEDQPMFLNAVAEIRTELEPEALLAELKRAEGLLGRIDSGRRRWGPREIDLDILLYGERVVESPDLVVPHPRLSERRFVVSQLVELDPDLIDPRNGAPLASYLLDL
jgi:2-amino-4-hydroxy-6-hydroxymethyldihydropteridine diphosphokinase